MYPLLLHLFQTKLQNNEGGTDATRGFSDTTRGLLQTCKESCRNMIGVLTILQQQGLLGGALPFDLERAFSSGFVSTILSVIDSGEQTYRALYSQACYLLEEFIHRGLTPATFRKSEIELLVEMIQLWKSQERGNTQGVQGGERAQDQREVTQHPGGDGSNDDHIVEHDFGAIYDLSPGATYDLSPGQIMSLAETIAVQDGQFENNMGWMDDWLWDHEGQQVQDL
ncbi:unnamed protein product [Clonostachys byssicola]|uniref:Uncharacterized protein n=1 Tax=Clonostachys byssicola TaxID=160290 RepID=A0A9N9UEB8_9HYPO|nr:unnamed protein product [Clonostachys byssicola]